MFTFIQNKRNYSIERFVFTKRINEIYSKSTIINIWNTYEQCFKNIFSITYENNTLLSNLEKSEDEILACILSKTYKYEIKRAMKESIVIDFFESSFISDNKNCLTDLHKVYINSCIIGNHPEIINNFDFEKLECCIKQNAVTISVAYFGNGKVFHIYLHDLTTALLLHSVSDFRNEGIDRNLAGRANKLLHYKSMLFFKKKGITTYDWGGIRNYEHPNGIDEFKISFGGKPTKTYNIFIGNTLWGKALITLMMGKELLKKRVAKKVSNYK